MAKKNRKAIELVDSEEDCVLNFDIFQFPKPELDRKMAIEWLSDKYIDLACALITGYDTDDADLRQDFASMAFELARVVEACAQVLQTGKPVRVVTSGGVDFAPATRRLARLVGRRDLIEGREVGCTERGFDELTRMFVERVEPTISASPDGGAA